MTTTGENVGRQVLASVVLSQTHIIFGVLIAYSGLFVSSTETGDSPHWSVQQVTWVVSALSIGGAIGCLMAAPLTTRLGVLRVIVFSSALNLAVWPALCFGETLPVLVVGRLLGGMFIGLNIGNSRIYIAEVSSERLRGVLCHLPAISISVAFLACLCLALVVPWRYAVLASGCLPTTVHLAGALLLPPSARWLLSTGGKQVDAERSIRFYRGAEHDVLAELKAVQASLGGEVRAPALLRQARSVLTEWRCAKPVLLLCGQFVFDAFCGGMTIAQFAPAVFRRAAPRLDPHMCTIYLAAFQLAALCGSGALVHRVGRRTVLAAAAGCGAAGCLLVAAAQLVPALGAHSWPPLLGVLLANAAAQAGIAPVSYLYLSELLPTDIRPLVGTSFIVYVNAANMAAVHLFPLATAAVGTHGLFLTVASFCGMQVVYALLVLPETKGLSLEEVQSRHFSTKLARGQRQQKQADVEAAVVQQKKPTANQQMAETVDHTADGAHSTEAAVGSNA